METLRMMNARARTIARALREGVRSLAKVLLWAQRNTLRVRAIRAEAKTVRPLNVILGAGPVTMQGWVATDAAVLDVTSSRAWKRLFTLNSIDRLMAEHLFEQR